MYVRVHVKPNSRKERIRKEDETTWYIDIKEPPEQNLANRRIQEILALQYGVSITQIHIVTGHRSSSKIYTVEGK